MEDSVSEIYKKTLVLTGGMLVKNFSKKEKEKAKIYLEGQNVSCSSRIISQMYRHIIFQSSSIMAVTS